MRIFPHFPPTTFPIFTRMIQRREKIKTLDYPLIENRDELMKQNKYTMATSGGSPHCRMLFFYQFVPIGVIGLAGIEKQRRALPQQPFPIKF